MKAKLEFRPPHAGGKVDNMPKAAELGHCNVIPNRAMSSRVTGMLLLSKR